MDSHPPITPETEKQVMDDLAALSTMTALTREAVEQKMNPSSSPPPTHEIQLPPETTKTTTSRRYSKRESSPMPAALISNVRQATKEITEAQEFEEKRKLLRKIDLYENWFPHLKGDKKKYTVKDSFEILLSVVDHYKQSLGMENAEATALFLFDGLFKGIEKFSHKYNPFHLNLNGLAEVASENKGMFDTEIKEIIIDYPWIFERGPFVRFLSKAVSLLWAVDKINSQAGSAVGLVNNLQTQVPTSLADKYADV